jgi:hypothetical protein
MHSTTTETISKPGQSEDNLLKKRRVDHYFIVNLSFGRVFVHVESFVLVKCQPFCLKTNLSRPYGWQREYLRSSGASEAASCPRHETE